MRNKKIKNEYLKKRQLLTSYDIYKAEHKKCIGPRFESWRAHQLFTKHNKIKVFHSSLVKIILTNFRISARKFFHWSIRETTMLT